METIKLFLALLGIVAAITLLIMKKETRTVLIGVGLVLCVLSLKPMDSLTAFTKSMTNANLIKAICASMGFAYVMKFTGCDKELVRMLTKPVKNIGFFLIPITVALTFFINIAIPSAAGCAAAVGATLIPLLMASGVKPQMAAAAVFAGTFGSVLSPGLSHNIFVTDMVMETNAAYTVQDVIAVQIPSALIALAITLVGISIMALILKDYQKGQSFSILSADKESGTTKKDDGNINYLHAIMPLIPLIILIIGSTDFADANSEKAISWLTWTKMGVAEAMLLGAILTIFVTMTNPQTITKEFFTGAGNSYASIMGIIIAAGVFVAGLKACGAVDYVIEALKNGQEYAKYGGTFIPFLMGLVTGSGDAAAMAFNDAVTRHAASFGMAQDELGMAVTIAGALGRSMSPIAGACIVCAGIAGINPIEITKRNALGMIVAVLVIAFIIL
ncbi:MAG: C4-dicarboxylate transporter DcuC [Campylobacter sp.]|nr:C4-dicarboxylate transporter DcuC [Campylobacter sp.]